MTVVSVPLAYPLAWIVAEEMPAPVLKLGAQTGARGGMPIGFASSAVCA